MIILKIKQIITRDLLTVGEVAEKLYSKLHTKIALGKAPVKHLSSTITEEDYF